MKSRFLTALLLAALPASALAGARDEAKVVMPTNAETLKIWEDWGFADAIVSGDTVHLSGVVAWTGKDEASLEPAYERAFKAIGAILGRAGASWDDVVEMTSYHTDLKTQMPAIVAVKKRYVRAPYPAWTAVQVVRLIPDQGITEIKVVAKLGKR